MLIPYNVEVPMPRLPLANRVLIAVTILISGSILIRPDDNADHRARALEESVWRRAKDKEISPEELQEYLQERLHQHFDDSLPALALKRHSFSLPQLVTYLFIHGDWLHLLGNMLFLFVFGNAVNAKLGHALFILFYLVLGALAGAAWLLLSSGPALVGASGAIMGLVGIFLVLFPRNDVQFYYMFTLAWWGTFSVSACWVILFYMGCDLYGTIRGGGGAVAYIAHLVGAVGGIATAFAMVSWGWLKPDRGEENLLQVLGLKKKRKTYREDIEEAKKLLRRGSKARQ